MTILSGEAIESFLKNIIHSPSQQQSHSFDLTVEKVYLVDQGGSLDFGGSEFEEAKIDLIPPVKKNENDKYGWWNLERAEYLIEFNEEFSSLEDDHLGIIVPLQRTLTAGVRITPMMITKQEKNPTAKALLSVQTDGVKIKENARVATLLVIQS